MFFFSISDRAYVSGARCIGFFLLLTVLRAIDCYKKPIHQRGEPINFVRFNYLLDRYVTG